MSDFFLNLATRVSDDANAVRPRAAGRFEPSEPMAELAETTEEIATVVDATPGPPQSSREPANPEFEPGMRREPRAQAIPPQSSLPSEPTRPVNPARIDGPQSSPPLGGRPEIVPADGDQSPEAASRAMSIGAYGSDYEELPQQNEMTIVNRVLRVQQRPDASPPKAETAVARPAEAEPAPIAAAATGQPAAIVRSEREIFVAQRPRELPTPADASPPPETVVHVTIGRVELRAPAAAAPRKREQAVSQAATLAEYLQKHAARTRS
jgi:hypothetical protein